MSDSVTPAGTVEIPAAGDYRIDGGGSTISFLTRHFFGLGPVRGTFSLRDGQIHVAEPVHESTVRATIEAASVRTGNSVRDTTVRSAQYLDAGNHPDIIFAAGRVEQADGRWVLRGSLTVQGRSRPLDVAIDAARRDGDRLRLSAGTRVDRYDFGITKMKGMTGRYLDIRLEIAADRY